MRSLSRLLLALCLAGLLPVSFGAAEPERVEVQHILVSFAGKIPGKKVTRTQEEPRTRAFDPKGSPYGWHIIKRLK